MAFDPATHDITDEQIVHIADGMKEAVRACLAPREDLMSEALIRMRGRLNQLIAEAQTG